MYTRFDPDCLRLSAYVWEGKGVLQNYGSGRAIVLAESIGEAWMRLKSLDEAAYYQLRTGKTSVRRELDLPLADPEDLIPEPGFPKQPKEIPLDKFNGLVAWGSE